MAAGILNIRGGTSVPASLEERELFLLFDDTTNTLKQVYAGPLGGGAPVPASVPPEHEPVTELIATGGVDENTLLFDILEESLGVRVYEDGVDARPGNSASTLTRIKPVTGNPYIPQAGDHINTILSKTDAGNIRLDPDTFPAGATLVFEHNAASGDISIVAGANVTIMAFAGNTQLAGRHATASAVHRGSNQWLVAVSAIDIKPPPPQITNIEGLDEQLIVYFTYDDSDFPVTGVEYSLDNGPWNPAGATESPIAIGNLTNGQNYSVRVRIVSGEHVSDSSNAEEGTPTGQVTVPGVPTITSVNSGDTEIFVNYSLGADGGSPITDVEYRLNGGSWQSGETTTTPLVITGQPNTTDEFTQIEIRAINSVGASGPSNSVFGRATKRLNLQRYFLLDAELISQNNGLTYDTIQMVKTTPRFHFNNRTDNTTDETWQIADGQAGAEYAYLPGIPGSMCTDADGNLKGYYGLRFPTTAENKLAVAVIESDDGGLSWNKPETGHRQDLVNYPQCNLVNVDPPNDGTGMDKSDLGNLKVTYDASLGLYIGLGAWRGEDAYYISTSNDGYTFTNTTRVVNGETDDEWPGDDNPGNIFFDENTDRWTIVFRSRGRSWVGPGAKIYPTPYFFSRFPCAAVANSTGRANYAGPYSILKENSHQKLLIDPADIYGYKGDTYADQDSFWSLEDQGTTCTANGSNDGIRNIPQPSGDNIAKIRTDFQTVYTVHYCGQYFMLPGAYFRDDNRSPYRVPDRTDGPTYPVWGHARILDGGLSKYHDDTNGTEGGWKFPTPNKSAVDLATYLRPDDNPCNLSGGVPEVGKASPGPGFTISNNKIVSMIVNANQLEEQRVYISDGTGNTNEKRTMEGALHTLDLDRFAKIEAGGTEGNWRTERIYIPKGTTKLLINTTVGSLQVEILNCIDNTTPIPGFTKADSVPITSSGFAQEATWSGASISELAGQNCRLKMYITNGAVFAFRFE